MRVVIILPTLDEGPLLAQTLSEAFRRLQGHEASALIVTSARLTTPETRRVIGELQQQYGGRVEAFDQVQPGVGCAIRECFARAQGDAVVIMTADLETPPEVLPAIMQKLEQGYDVVVTTRWRRGITLNGYHPVKFVLNFLFQQIFRVLYMTTLSDLTYGYRAFRTGGVKSVRWEESRPPFFFETILKPLRLGYKIAEVDASWDTFIARKASTGRAKPKDLLAYLRTGVRNRFLSKQHMRL